MGTRNCTKSTFQKIWQVEVGEAEGQREPQLEAPLAIVLELADRVCDGDTVDLNGLPGHAVDSRAELRGEHEVDRQVLVFPAVLRHGGPCAED
jgi:hypothetical protein